MSSLLKGGTVLLVSVCFAAPSSAQATKSFQAITSPVKDAGIFRVATGTWDRTPGSILAIGSFTVFDNTAPSGYFTGSTPDMTFIGEGRVPSLSSEGTSNSYRIKCWAVGYCTSTVVGANIEVNTAWYKQYDSCHDPDVDGGPGAVPISPVGSQLTGGLPGTSAVGTQSCWIVTIDFSGTTDEFTLPADGNGNFDNILGVEELDDIGFSMRLRTNGDNPLPPNTATAATGFIIRGDPLNEPHGSGTNPVWGFPAGIDPAIGTGLHEEDRFYIEDNPPSLPMGNGCYFFGGYPGNPWAGLHHEIFGDDVVLGTNYCTAATTLFSSGTTSGISASGSSSITANDLVITASGLPNAPDQPGIFIAGPESALIPLYCGNLCISFNGLQRFVSAGSSTGGVITENIDYATSAAGGLNVMAGMVMNYQRWNRDPSTAAQAACNGTGMGSPSPTANFSDAIAIMHTP